MKKYFTVSAMMLGMATLALTSCSNEDELGDGNLQRHITVKIGRPMDDATRAVLSEDEGNLTANWSAGDKVAVFNATTGTKLGILTVSDGAGTPTATFEGELTGLREGDMNFSFAHLGTTINYEELTSDYVHSVATQTGKLADLGQHDALTSTHSVTVGDKGLYIDDFGLHRDVVFAHFTLEFGNETVTDDVAVSISGEGVNNQAPVKFSDGTLDLTNAVAGAVNATATPNGTNAEVYVALLPGTMTLKFNASMGGKTYEASLPAATLAAGKYIRAAEGSGIPVVMNEYSDNNPGNTDNWPTGGDNIAPSYTESPVTFVSQADGWTVNVRSLYNYGGFGTYITYNNNGLKGRYVSSLSGNGLCYFQWGRWLGFPPQTVNTHINEVGSYSGSKPTSSQYLLGVNILNTDVGYTFGKNLPATYATCWMGSTDWTPLRVNRSSIIFGKVDNGYKTLDYIGANEDCSWYDRSGNPCPDGYRLPTAEELSVFIPSTENGHVNGSYAEVKTIKGVKYAMQWKVVAATSDTFPYVAIKSVRTTSNTVSVDDAIFNDAKEIRFYGYGYLNNACEQSGVDLDGKGFTGMYWTSESAAQTGGTYSLCDSGFGGKALLIDFGSTSTEINMYMFVAPRSFGGLIMPIKDSTAKADSLTPWFPVTLSW